MKNIRWLIYIFTILYSNQLLAQPRLHIVEGENINWGKVSARKLQTNLTLKNIGSDTLYIRDIKVACGCTTAPIDKTTLAPGETGSIYVTMDTELASGGALVKTIEIESNDSTTPLTVVNLHAYVIRDIIADKSFFPMLKAIKVNEEFESSIIMENTSNKEQLIFQPSVLTNDSLQVQFKSNFPVSLAAGEKYILTAKIRPNKTGVSDATVKIRTTGEHNREFDIKAYCSVSE